MINEQGKFEVIYPGVSGKVFLSETEEKLFLYICFLNIAEFWEDIETIDKNAKLLNFNKLNYQFIEYKDKNWLKPSSILVIYTSSLIQKGNEGPYKRLTIGPISLTEFWNADYVHNNSLNEIIAENTPKYVIENVDYVNGTCKLFDKINMRFLTVNLDKIKNLNNFEFDGIIDNYDEMFHVKRKTNII